MSYKPTTKINRSDLQIFASERLTDEDDGGGFPTAIALTGKPNELFNPISNIARVNGSFELRLVYQGMQLANDEMLIGAFSAITQPSLDENVSYLMFPVDKFGASRADIVNRVEAHSVATIESRMTLMSIQTKNSKFVQAYQEVGEPLPVVGETFCIDQSGEKLETAMQFIKVESVESEYRTFTSPSGQKFSKTVVKITTTDKLLYDFYGIDYPVEGYANPSCKLKETQQVNAAQYYGVKPLKKAINKATKSLQVSSIFEQLVPTNKIEEPMVDRQIGMRNMLIASGKDGDDGVATISMRSYIPANEAYTVYLPTAISAGSITLSASKVSIIERDGYLVQNGNKVANIDYQNGCIKFYSTNRFYLYSISYRPATKHNQVSHTAKIDINLANQGTNYNLTLNPAPAVGSLMVSYRSQGRWYDLYADDLGKLGGTSDKHGSGNINHATATASISCGALPDLGSSILFAWATDVNVNNRCDSELQARYAVKLDNPAYHKTLTLSWKDARNYKRTAQCDSKGIITGDCEGYYDRDTDTIYINLSYELKPQTQINLSYQGGNKISQELTYTRTLDGIINANLNKAVKPFSFSANYSLTDNKDVHDLVSNRSSITVVSGVVDDGQGNLLDSDDNKVLGTIDYTTGTLQFNSRKTVKGDQAIYSEGDNGGLVFDRYETIDVEVELRSDMIAHYYSVDNYDSYNETIEVGTIEIDLLPNYQEQVLENSILFAWQAKYYFVRQGFVYTDYNTSNNSGVKVGSFDSNTNIATIDIWRYIKRIFPHC